MSVSPVRFMDFGRAYAALMRRGELQDMHVSHGVSGNDGVTCRGTRGHVAISKEQSNLHGCHDVPSAYSPVCGCGNNARIIVYHGRGQYMVGVTFERRPAVPGEQVPLFERFVRGRRDDP